MNERNLSRRLSSSVVEALKAHGHILVVKGGATALARELSDLMAPEVATIEPRLQPYTVLVGEPTSTFGDEAIDQAVEDMVVKLTHALMNSDHVEDVFAEDAVIRRDIFRVVRDGLRERREEAREEDEGHGSVTVKLDMLGYVAATASRRADATTLRQALDRAASASGARFSGFSAELREATFRLDGDSEDERLELEEAVADELTDLVEQGVVELPMIERRVELPRAVPASELRSLRARVDAAADGTLRRSGCAATWELVDPRTVRVLFTPLSDQDARAVDAPAGAFARELTALLVGEPGRGSPNPSGAARERGAGRVGEPGRGSPNPSGAASPASSKSSSTKAPPKEAPAPRPPSTRTATAATAAKAVKSKPKPSGEPARPKAAKKSAPKKSAPTKATPKRAAKKAAEKPAAAARGKAASKAGPKAAAKSIRAGAKKR